MLTIGNLIDIAEENFISSGPVIKAFTASRRSSITLTAWQV
jgi:hypothetical protein